MNFFARRVALILVGVLASCVSLPSSTAPPVRLFTLPPLVADSGPGPRATGTVRIEEPILAAAYRGTFVAIRDGERPSEIRYSREARFAASLGSLLGERLADVAKSGGTFGAVLYPGQAGAADWKLSGRIEIFECRVAGAAMEARVAATVDLERARASERVFSRRYEETSPIPSVDAAAVVEELGRAFDRLAIRAVADAADAAEAAAAAPPPPAKSL